MTTIDTITDDQIRALETEAGAAGDLEMATICRVALGEEESSAWTEETARTECVRVIREAEDAR